MLLELGSGHPLALLILFAALALDGVLPERRWPFSQPPHPVRILGAAIAGLDGRLNRPNLGPGTRVALGVLTAGVVLVASGVLGLGLHSWARAVPFGWTIEVAAVVSLLAQRSLFAHVRRVERPLARDDLDAARQAVGHIVGRDPRTLDRHGVARAAIESLVENFSDGVVAPALFYAVFGLPGLFIYKAANTLDSMIGHRTPRHLAFGRFSARFDDALNLVPARLSAALLAAAAAFMPGGRPFQALATALRDAGKHRSVNAGWPEAAAAGALGLALAGPRRYAEEIVDDAWLGAGAKRAEAGDVARALRLYVIACALFAMTVGIATIGSGAAG